MKRLSLCDVDERLSLCDVDDVLHIAKDPKGDMALINSIYRLKEGVGPPDRYLGGSMERVQLQDGSVAWSMNCVEYLQGAISNVDNFLKECESSLKMYGDGINNTLVSYVGLSNLVELM